jgi:hypothetical protein
MNMKNIIKHFQQPSYFHFIENLSQRSAHSFAEYLNMLSHQVSMEFLYQKAPLTDHQRGELSAYKKLLDAMSKDVLASLQHEDVPQAQPIEQAIPEDLGKQVLELEKKLLSRK